MPEAGLRLGAQRVLFVGGKGGVGKTTTASALALALAEAGARCLLVSTDPAHSLGDLFGVRLDDDARPLGPNLVGLEIDPERAVERHLHTVRDSLREYVRPGLYAAIDRQMDLARMAPGGVEAAVLERVAALMVEAPGRYDRVVFDTAPTGQTLRLLALPAAMTAWVDGLLGSRRRADALGDLLARVHQDAAPGTGPEDAARGARIRETLLARRHTFSEARRVLLDPTETAFVLVLVPEKLPVAESRKALAALRDADVPVHGLVVNRVLPPGPLGAFLEARRAQEAIYRRAIAQLAGPLPVAEVPLLPRDVDGIDALRAVAGHLRGSGDGG